MRLINKIALKAGEIFNFFQYPFFSERELLYQVNTHTSFRVRKRTSDVGQLKEIWNYRHYRQKDYEIRSTDVVMDIGAYIGDFAIYAAQKAFRGIVYALEPDPDNYRLLVWNKKYNKVTNLKTYKQAITNKNGKTKLFFSQSVPTLNSIMSGHMNLYKTVSSMNLLTFMQKVRIKRLNFLKIDIEGGEYDLILNLNKEVLNKIEKIVLEFHDYINGTFHYKIMKDYLEANGFSVHIVPAFFSYKLLKQGYLWARRM